MAGKMDRIDAVIISGGLATVAVAGILFAAFPLFQLLDGTIVRRPLWNRPSVVIREPGQGLKAEDIARLEQDPHQAELIKELKAGLIYRPSPSWSGLARMDVNRPVPGRRYPNNALLYLFVASLAGYVYALKHRGII